MKMKINRATLHKSRWALPLMSVILILVLLAGNVGLYALVVEKNGYIDITDEGLYTLSEEFKEEISGVKKEITITFCTDPDYLLSSYESRYVYIMAKEIEKLMDNVKVLTVNINKNPTAVQKYKVTSATKIRESDVIVSCEDRYSIIRISAFWSYDSTGEEHWAFNGEFRMANAFLMLSAYENPTVYFTVGHGEKIYDLNNPDSPESKKNHEFYKLLINNGLKVKTIDLDREEIPEDCTLLIMNGPTEDYSASEEGLDRESYFYVNTTPPVEKIDRYMDKHGAVMIFTDPFVQLPTLEEYLLEWGMKIEHHEVKELRVGDSERNLIPLVFADEENYPLGNSLYSDIVSLASPPKAVVRSTGYIERVWDKEEILYSAGLSAMYSPVFFSSPEARAYDSEGLVYDTDGGYHLSALTVRSKTDPVSSLSYNSYMFVGTSTEFCSSQYLSNGAYANRDILSSMVRILSNPEVFASYTLGAESMNTENYGGKILNKSPMTTEAEAGSSDYPIMTAKKAAAYTAVSLSLALIVLPVICLCITARRKYL